MKKILLFLLFILIFTPAAEARNVRVMLSSSKQYSVKSDSNMTATDAANKSHNIGKSANLSVSGQSVTIAGKKAPLPLTIKSSSLLGFKGYKYRGTFRISRGGELVNILDAEDYVRGVIKAEANPNWHMEYLKVQAIVSRTFGLRESLAAGARDYDVLDSTASQVYHGASAESPRTDQAVRETANRVLAYGNELAGTYFHSDSGGATANMSDVWGKDVPYLRAAKEPISYTSPNSTWEKKISQAEVSRAIQKVLPRVGTVREIYILNTDSFGRAVNLKIVGTGGTDTIKASAFRTAVGPNSVKSTFFTASGAPQKMTQQPPKPIAAPEPRPLRTQNSQAQNFNTPMTAEEEMQLTQLVRDGAFDGKTMMEILTKPEKRKEYLYKYLEETTGKPAPKTPQTPNPQPSEPIEISLPPAIESGKPIPFEGGHFVFRGRGWGHGVGLSQYGGMALANSGWNAEKILMHYFPGTKVKTTK